MTAATRKFLVGGMVRGLGWEKTQTSGQAKPTHQEIVRKTK